jgi:hypothetical protein
MQKKSMGETLPIIASSTVADLNRILSLAWCLKFRGHADSATKMRLSLIDFQFRPVYFSFLPDIIKL